MMSRSAQRFQRLYYRDDRPSLTLGSERQVEKTARIAVGMNERHRSSHAHRCKRIKLPRSVKFYAVG
ncbi:hypothetical protein JMJ78_0000868 [Colletotrichum scovillei]|nr:hypothetical protein JMJ78_0000868 [Colletotrichum scovillei]